MNGQSTIDASALSWLLEVSDPGVRYLALRDLAGDISPAELAAARRQAHTAGPVAAVLAAMHPGGYWAEPGPGYNPKYFSSVWALILLAQLGASCAEDARIARACAYILDHALAPGGQFTTNGAPSGTVDCLQGNLCWALVTLSCDDPRLAGAFDWLARSVTGEGIAPAADRQAPVRYYAGKCGPVFACGANNKLPCAWGAVKVLLALSAWPVERRTPQIEAAIEQGVDFIFSIDPATAAYPAGWSDKPSGNWWKFGFPVFYVTDLLQLAEALCNLGYTQDARLANTFELILQKRDPLGCWPLEYDYAGKTHVEFGPKKQPNKWVTLRALRVLHAAGLA